MQMPDFLFTITEIREVLRFESTLFTQLAQQIGTPSSGYAGDIISSLIEFCHHKTYFATGLSRYIHEGEYTLSQWEWCGAWPAHDMFFNERAFIRIFDKEIPEAGELLR